MTRLATFIMIFVPCTQTNIAELVTTTTFHMVAPLTSLDKHVAVGASLPVLEILLKIYITRPLMSLELALFAVLSLASIANMSRLRDVDQALFTSLLGAKSKVWVTNGLFPQAEFIEFFLGVFR